MAENRCSPYAGCVSFFFGEAMSRRAEFVAEIAQAARQRMRRRRPPSQRQLDALEAARAEDPMRGVIAARMAPRCGAMNRNGRPCGAPAMRGADRCAQHGGRMRAGPDHPGNVRWLLSGRAHLALAMQETRREGRRALAELSTEEAMLLARSAPASATMIDRLAGAIALRRARVDGGAEWSRWLTTLPP